MSNGNPQTTFQHLSGMFDTAKQAYGNYQGASGIQGFGLFQTAQHAYQHRNDTFFGKKTYGVQPLQHPIFANRLRTNINTLKQQGDATARHVDRIHTAVSSQPGWNDS